MNRFWEPIILPILNEIKAEHIVEIGCCKGENTKKILKYCFEQEAKLSVIDPSPKVNIDKLKEQHGGYFNFYKDLSLNALPSIKDYDVVLIDGDHNWYTVYNELKIIEDSIKNQDVFLVFLHDISWPYGRRDMYYNPETIPEEFKHSHEKKGIFPAKEDLVEGSGFNYNSYNAVHEGGAKNGVLTGMEDYIEETNLKLRLKKIKAFHGLGILYQADKDIGSLINKIILDSNLISLLEKERINLKIKIEKLKKRINKLTKD